MILSVYLALPDIDNKRRSIKITEGLRAAANSGRWLGHAPYGYSNAKDEKNKPIIVPNEKAQVVKTIFYELVRGKSQAEVREGMKKKGFNIPRATFSVIVRNRAYVGEVHVKSEKGGYYVKGLHQPLVDEKVFEKVQAYLKANYKVQQQSKPKTFRDDLPLRGLILCESCEKSLTGSASRSKTGARHYYYHCNHCGGHRTRAANTHEKLEEILSELKVTSEATKLYEAMVKKLLGKQKPIMRPLEKVKAEIVQLEKRLESLDDNFLDKIIDADSYTKAKTRYNGELQKLKAELTPSTPTQTEFQRLTKSGIHLLEKLPSFYQKSTVQTKRDIVSSIFPEKLTISENKSRTPKINEAVLLISATDKGFIGKKRDNPLKI